MTQQAFRRSHDLQAMSFQHSFWTIPNIIQYSFPRLLEMARSTFTPRLHGRHVTKVNVTARRHHHDQLSAGVFSALLTPIAYLPTP